MDVETPAAVEEEKSSPKQFSIIEKVKQLWHQFSDRIFLAIGLFFRFLDVATDTASVVNYFMDGDTWWGGLTLVFVIVPTYAVQALSLYRMEQGPKNHSVTFCVTHIIGLGVEYRYIVALMTALTGTSEQLEKQTRSLTKLNIFNNFESAPQLILQVYISLKLEDITLIRGATMFTSLVFIAWSISSVTARDGGSDEAQLRPWGEVLVEVLVVTFWITASLTARMVAFIVLALTSATCLGIFIGLHWLAMIAWELYRESQRIIPQNYKSVWDKMCFTALMGLFYSFHYYDPHKGPLLFWINYIVFLLENLGFVVAYVIWRDHLTTELSWGAVFLSILVGLTSVLDLLLLMVYLYHFQSNGRKFLPSFAACARSKQDVESRGGQNRKSPRLPPITAPISVEDPQVEQQQASLPPPIVRVNTVNPILRVTSRDSQEADLSAPTALTSVDIAPQKVEQQQTSPFPPILRVRAKITMINPIFRVS